MRNKSPTTVSFDDDEAHTRGVRLALLGVAFLICCGLSTIGVSRYQTDAISLYNLYFPTPTATSTGTRTPIPSVTPSSTMTSAPTVTLTPTLTRTPHLLLTPSNEEIVLEDEFDSNTQGWEAYYGTGNAVSVRDGKLYLASDDERYVGLATCAGCATQNDIFYLQAEVVPAQQTNLQHGLAICLSEIENQYYTFVVDSSQQFYSLFKNTGSDWDILIQPTSSETINRYPLSNTLAILFDRGRLDLFINGNSVTTFEDEEPYRCLQYGIFIDGGIVEVVADNLFAYEIEANLTATSKP